MRCDTTRRGAARRDLPRGNTLRRETGLVTLAFLAVERTSRTKKDALRNGEGRSCHIPDFPVYLDVTKRCSGRAARRRGRKRGIRRNRYEVGSQCG